MRAPPRPKPAPMPRPRGDEPLLRQSEESIRALQDDIGLLTEDQIRGFIEMLQRLNPHLDLSPVEGEFNVDFNDIDPRTFRELEKYVQDMKELNARQRGALGHAALLTSPAMESAGYMAYGSPAPTPLGAGAQLVSDSDSSDSDSDSD